MARDNSSLYVLSIVAVVAVVGLVTLFMNGSVGTSDASVLVGQAISDDVALDEILIALQPGDDKISDTEISDKGVREQRVLWKEKGGAYKEPFVSREASKVMQIAS